MSIVSAYVLTALGFGLAEIAWFVHHVRHEDCHGPGLHGLKMLWWALVWPYTLLTGIRDAFDPRHSERASADATDDPVCDAELCACCGDPCGGTTSEDPTEITLARYLDPERMEIYAFCVPCFEALVATFQHRGEDHIQHVAAVITQTKEEES